MKHENGSENGHVRGESLKVVRESRNIFPELSTSTACIVVFLVAVLCYFTSLRGGFVFDDTEAVLNNEDVKPGTPISQVFQNDFWGTNIRSNNSHKSYRPLTILTFKFNYFLSEGLNARDFHLTNLFLHGIVSSLSIIILSWIFNEPQPRLSFMSAVIFSIHPVHTEAVAGIVGRADLLCCLFFFMSFLAYIYHVHAKSWIYFIISMISCAIAMLCKEQGITVLGINAIYDLIIIVRFKIWDFSSKPTAWKHFMLRCTLMALVSFALLYCRWTVMGSTTPAFQKVDNPASFSSSLITRILTYNYVYSIHALLLVLPHWLCFDWSMGCIPLVTTLWDIRNLASLSLWIFISCSTYQAFFNSNERQRRYLMLSLSLVLIPFLPATNLFFRVGFVVAERILFISVAGYAMLFVYGFEKLNIIFPYVKIWRTYLVFVLLFFALKSFHRTLDWTNESRLFRSALKVCPLNAKVHYNIGKNAADQGLRELAISEYEVALELNPDYDQAMNNLANLLKDSGHLGRAENLLLRAVQVRPDFAAAWMNKGIVEAILKKFDEARNSYLTALTHRKKYPDCYYNLGNLYLELERFNDAYDAFRNATQLQPLHILAWTNLIVMLDNIGQTEKAELVAHEALKLLPHEANLHFSLAGMLGKQGRFSESEHHFQRAIQLKPDNPTYHTNLGVLYHRWKRYDEAEQCYHRALSIDPYLKSPIENLRLLQKVKLSKAP